MIIQSIILQNFRSFSKTAFQFSHRTTVIVGPNASGKTNILEAIYLVSTGKSFKAGVEREMVKEGSEFTRVSGQVVRSPSTLRFGINEVGRSNESSTHLEVLVTRDQQVGNKKLSINGLPKRLIDYQGNLRVVLFGPWDLGLIVDAPSVRRKFLDNVLSQVDREYRRCFLSYERGLRQRNRLLLRIRDYGANRAQLTFWDRLLIKNGDYISGKREELIEFINKTDPLGVEKFVLVYDKSAISEARLVQYEAGEVAAGTTLVGPHRDDIEFKLKVKSEKLKVEERDLAVYGSRGEQRMCVLWVKMAELLFIENVTRYRPVLLLDDIFSELDHSHRQVVMSVIERQQTILTTADPHTVEDIKSALRIEPERLVG